MKNKDLTLAVSLSLLVLGIPASTLLRSMGSPTSTGAAQILIAGGAVESLAWSPDGKLLAAGVAIPAMEGGGPGHTQHQVQLCNAETGDWRLPLEGHTALITGLAFSPDGKLLASGSRSEVKLWDSRTGALRRTLTRRHGDRALIAFCGYGRRVATWDGSQLKLWNVQNGALERSLPGFDWRSFPCVASSSRGETLAVSSIDQLKLWDLRTGETRQMPPPQCGEITAVAISPEGSTLACGGQDGTIVVWDLTDREVLATPPRRLRAHSGAVKALAFSDDGQLPATAGRCPPGDGGGAEVWVLDVTSGSLRQRLGGHEDRIGVLAFRPRRHTLASGSDDGTIRYWPAP